MQWPQDCAAIVPCWNEALAIDGLVRGLRVMLPAVYVVDDGSTDPTSLLARAAGAQVLAHPGNRGKGAALQTGLSAACRAGYCWAVLLDGDGQHMPADLPALLACAARTGADLVVGDRMGAAREMPWLRRRVNRWMSRHLSRLAGVPLPDSQCGYRLVRLEAWRNVTLHTARFETESEMLLAFLRAGYHIEFVPVTVLRARRPSRIRVLGDTGRWLRWRWRAGRPDPSTHGTEVRLGSAESTS